MKSRIIGHPSLSSQKPSKITHLFWRRSIIYYHLRRNSQWFANTGWRFLPRPLGLTLFIRGGFLANSYLAAMGGLSLDDFDFVGITEQWERSLKLFGMLFDIDTKFNGEKLNANPDQLNADSLSRCSMSNFGRDRALYQSAVARFEALCSKASV